jgi:DNA-binding MarR family transcriptional regulator
MAAHASYHGGMSATPDAAVPDDRLTADLGWGLAVVFRGFVKAADAVTEGLPGGHRGYQVLSAAAQDEPGSQASLATRLGIDRTVMTYLLDDLVQAGLVERRQDPGDRRTRLVLATDHGRAVLADLRARLARAEQHILAGLSPQEQQSFRTLLATAARHVNDPDPVRSACDAVEDITRGGRKG